jgi:hypothetical protein
MASLLALALSSAHQAAAAAPIDRAAVVQRHQVHFAHPHGVVDAATLFNALTVGNGEIGFTADLTGLQSLNNSYHTPDYPLYTLSNWGWHTPDPTLPPFNAKQQPFQANGELNYVYENVSINSADTRPGKGNRTVPYQFNCARYNDPALCRWMMNFPARANLGQLSFVLAAPPHTPAPAPPHPQNCTGIGRWCSGGPSCRGRTISVHANTCASLALSPLPLICSYQSEKSLCGAARRGRSAPLPLSATGRGAGRTHRSAWTGRRSR